jgi:hypothetical protein
LFEDGFEVFDDFLPENIRIGEVVGLFEACVSELQACGDHGYPRHNGSFSRLAYLS